MFDEALASYMNFFIRKMMLQIITFNIK